MLRNKMKIRPEYKKAAKTALIVFGMVALTAAVAFAETEGGEDATTTMDWVWRVVDFAIIAGVLVYFVSRPFKNFFRSRVEGIEAALAEAKTAREEAIEEACRRRGQAQGQGRGGTVPPEGGRGERPKGEGASPQGQRADGRRHTGFGQGEYRRRASKGQRTH